MTASVAETVERMATALLVVPVVVAGAHLLIGGQVGAGAVLLAIAGLMIAISEYVTRPSDVPTSAAQRVVGWVATEPKEDE
ncbi:DUF7533 family protein [Halapricum hydrolyticum]|uniref:Uncharacterized protein n=1 Tax=Halapricum hydrolyticum TaxID=2979991 RepID=A0AAE3IBM0_9EURY|nr:hypothetical protein [Halapricum hydrolyticum]MCU4718699.1 hypothetical protein [Halapricum hydrolyticum]MCU4727615.1 hypothetical protein [Halapricum hydrolyticum]